MSRSSRFADTDVVILGSGLAGSITALCLARRGLRVAILDQGTHPRLAVGESTTTPSSLWLRLLAELFDVPDLLHIANAESIIRHVAPSSGLKNNFGFLYHTVGADRAEHSWQAIIAQASLAETENDSQPSYNEMHYFRQDVDAWLWATALHAGVVGRPATTATDISFDADGVTVTTSANDTMRCGFVVDASGYRSVLADQLSLRETPPRMRTNSRTLFTHMVGVEPYETFRAVERTMAPWSQGTLHHFFDGGWLWVIPFDNHTTSTNKLCSVGLSLDNRRFPRTDGRSAEQEWQAFLSDYPAIRCQFERAVAVRPWVHTCRLQYSSKRCVGQRFWMTPHATGAVDALYSMGNIHTFQSIATGVSLILRAFEDGDFDARRFEPLQRLTDNLLRFHDRITYGHYVAFRSPRLLETWISLWALTDAARIRHVLIPLVKHARTRDRDEFAFCAREPENFLTGFGHCTGVADTDTVLGSLDAWCDIMGRLENGEQNVDETCEQLESAVRSEARYQIPLEKMGEVLRTLPWAYEPLSRSGLRCYSNAFLTPHEMDSLGVRPEPRGRTR